MSEENQVTTQEGISSEAILGEINPIMDELKTDLVKFFDKGQKAAGKRIRKNSLTLGKLMKELRGIVSEIKAERKVAKASE